ncbi:MAG: carbamoyltransferase HypF, partial [Cyclobacteriaceae bacterium]|nr:carbamoyltransferase HypF [Cyclobacteriaceae bacterium]
MKSFHIHIKGRVQGIGFRPFIYKLAKENGFDGTVSNSLNGVHIFINGEAPFVENFINQILDSAPEQSLITSTNYKEIPYRQYSDFIIVGSDLEGTPDLLITPDFAICDRCKTELKDPQNRRYNYPYITCTACGPRYSIEEGLPYDRNRTSMKTFEMCESCGSEFSNPMDYRFYSQTNSCPECRISQWVVDSQGKKVELQEEEIVNFICEKIANGAMVAVKGIGGFLLICDAENEEAVNDLRKEKHRPAKPFALMYPNMEFARKRHPASPVGRQISIEEEQELKSSASPIVLLQTDPEGNSTPLHAQIAPGLDRLGVMLPYAPLLVLLAEKLNRPLLATSGNQKGSPIIYKNQEALKSLAGFADYFLFNDRDIQIPQDDSVINFSKKYHKKIVIRRSRGYAPGFMQNAIDPSFNQDVLALGALLKSTFCIWKQGRCHVSQFLGDTTEFDAQISYEQTLNHFQKLLQFKPNVILVDKHPTYFSTQFGK